MGRVEAQIQSYPESFIILYTNQEKLAMASENVVSIVIPAEDVAAVQDAIKVIEEKLKPHLVALQPAERKELPKMSDKTAPFVEKVLDYAESDAEFAPAYLDVPELKKDLDAVGMLTLVARPIEQLSEMLNDTIMLAGSEAFVASLAYYNSVKQAAKMNVPGAKNYPRRFSQML